MSCRLLSNYETYHYESSFKPSTYTSIVIRRSELLVQADQYIYITRDVRRGTYRKNLHTAVDMIIC